MALNFSEDYTPEIQIRALWRITIATFRCPAIGGDDCSENGAIVSVLLVVLCFSFAVSPFGVLGQVVVNGAPICFKPDKYMGVRLVWYIAVQCA
jgi:hypothetical protein